MWSGGSRHTFWNLSVTILPVTPASLFVFRDVFFQRVFVAWSIYPDKCAFLLRSSTFFTFAMFVTAFFAATLLCRCHHGLRLSRFVHYIIISLLAFRFRCSHPLSHHYRSLLHQYLYRYHNIIIIMSSQCFGLFVSDAFSMFSTIRFQLDFHVHHPPLALSSLPSSSL